MCSEISGEQPSHKTSNEARQDIGAARQFLQYLAGIPDAVFQFRVLSRNDGIPQNRHGTFADCCDYLIARNAAGFDIYVTINETNGGTTGDDVIAVRAVFADFDEILVRRARRHAQATA